MSLTKNQPVMPLGPHPQCLNLLPWRTQYIHYRWLTLRRWGLGLSAVFALWIVGLMVLTQFYQLSHATAPVNQHPTTGLNAPSTSTIQPGYWAILVTKTNRH